MDVDKRYSAYNLYTMDALMGAHWPTCATTAVCPLKVLRQQTYQNNDRMLMCLLICRGVSLASFICAATGAGKTLNPGER
jgi:hypothetical protein